MDDLIRLLKEAMSSGHPYCEDEAIHAAMLINNGWSAREALAESKRTLAEAEQEGAY